ncbi:uncharacterized protein BX664DRAFT_321628 [Halteromyces radiatus]|uniref:uncharacterized protein n=1 Tax=Halteromyces radiatus TaxID=101107 RepID=UPI0022204F96|nr:uncharacterized protein BX664DRAFT_321628 [Halteromyces radiatus]KAI8099573.1 hypothetical protein BX664DRAFT_321628 [Halteromyces radiatus]
MAQHVQHDSTNINNIKDLVGAIPHMSKTIVDDTLYEKVLTILTTFLDSHTSHSQLLDEWQVFDILQEACQQPDQDYRVLSVCLRLLGKWISVSDDALFYKLETHYLSLLTLMVSALRTSEPALRCASLEACQGLIHVPQGSLWLLKNKDVKSLISLSLMDESIYVVTQGCRFYLSLMEQTTNSQACIELSKYMDPSIQIKHFLLQHHHLSLLIAALEFCWTFANSTCPSVYNYLEQTQLLFPLPDLFLKVNNKMIRKRMIEILSVVCRCSPSPIRLLTSNDDFTQEQNNDHHLEKAYTFIQTIYNDMIIHQPNSIDDACTGVEIIQVSLELLGRLKEQQRMTCVTKNIHEISSLLMTLLGLCIMKNGDAYSVTDGIDMTKVIDLLQMSNRPVVLQCKLLQAIIKALNSLIETFTLEVKNADGLEAALTILSEPSFSRDQKLLKECLQLVITSLHCQSNQVSSLELQSTFFKFMTLLISKMDDDSVDSQNLALILSTFNQLLGHQPFQAYLLQPEMTRPLMDVIRLKFVDVEWDVRDAVIEFVAGLFESRENDHISLNNKINFAISLDLPLLVLDRIKDQEAYVRASALRTVQMMMKTGPGWIFIQQHERLRNLSSTLPRLLYDTEAFVRRATLDAMNCLVEHRSCEGLLLTQPDQDPTTDQKDILSSDTLAMLMNDDDIEVRIRLCQLLDSLWQLRVHERNRSQQHSKTRQGRLPYFYLLQGDHWLLEAVTIRK